MQNQLVRGASIFINLCVRELPLRELFPNCILVIQSTKGKCSLLSLKFPNKKVFLMSTHLFLAAEDIKCKHRLRTHCLLRLAFI